MKFLIVTFMWRFLKMNAKKMMSKNFSEDEMKCPCCGVLPKPELVQKLQVLRERLGRSLSVNSAMRCEAYNTKIGGASKSQHINGVAVDIRALTGIEKYQIVDEALRAGFHGIGIADTFIHLDLRTAPGVIFTYGNKGGN